MTHVRESIEALSSVLKNILGAFVSAEMFRKAKFDQPEATELMWTALGSLLGCHGSHKTGSPKDSKKSTEAERANLLSACRHEMFKRGYRVADFFQLPCDMSTGSREILLALGWLLAKDSVFEMLCSRIQPVYTEDPPFDLTLAENIPISRATFEASMAMDSRGSLGQRASELMQQLIMVNGKLNACLRMLWSSRNEYGKLTSKIHIATSRQHSQKQQPPNIPGSSGPNHLSPCEVYLLRYPKEMTKYLAALEHQNSCIHSLLTWIEKEPLFWKWMESVLEAKLKGCLEISSQKEHQDFNLTDFEYKPSAVLQKTKSQQVELSGLFQSQEHTFKRVSKTWKRLRADMGGAESLEKERGDVVQSMDRELVEQIEQLQIQSDEAYRRGQAGYKHLHFAPKSQTGDHIQGGPNQMDAAAEIRRFSEEVRSLEKELSTLQQRNREKMLKISENFDNIICIPPQF